MPATIDKNRRIRETVTAVVPLDEEIGEDGYPLRRWKVRDPRTGTEEERTFSLRPYTQEEKNQRVYWNPIYPGQTMLWRDTERNDWGVEPVIQRECWLDGAFSPRNEWEEFMTVEYVRSLPGGEPEKWKGYNHPDNEPGSTTHHYWRCECGWRCGNWQAFRAHARYLRHRESAASE